MARTSDKTLPPQWQGPALGRCGRCGKAGMIRYDRDRRECVACRKLDAEVDMMTAECALGMARAAVRVALENGDVSALDMRDAIEEEIARDLAMRGKGGPLNPVRTIGEAAAELKAIYLEMA